MKTKYNIIIATFVLLFAGCNDLEEEIYSDFQAANFFETEEQIQTQALGLYQSFGHVFWEWYLYDLTAYPSQYTVTRGGDVWWKKTVYAIHETTHLNRVNTVWSLAYQAINRANNLIKYAPTSPLYKSNPELIDQYIAEAKWVRAYFYFNLVQLFGDVPIYTEPSETTDEEILFKGREPKGDVYDLIIEDLTYASENLPVNWSRTPRGRANKATATLLLGKVYLTSAGLPLQRTENYQKAIDVLKPLADNPGDFDVELLSDWKSIFDKDNEENKEILFAINKVRESKFGGVLPHVTTPRQSPFSASNGSYNAAHNYALVELYEDGDVRKTDGFIHSYTRTTNGTTVTYNPNANNFYGGRNGICGTKFIDEEATTNTQHEKDVIFYRYVDAFIMLAEAFNEISMPSEALQYLKVARDRVNASEITTMDQAELRQIIRDERAREFYDEFTELYDIRRWGTAQENFENHPTRQWRAPDLMWDDKYLLTPIPDQQTALNPNLLPNNPGW